ncbi:hypothetical protein [Burkholderia sp. 22PA0106]|uniref:immunity protein Imm33 domain-containing protein n=1 Tax=Burkholderia sp. 22PA0106 TaxID=3237371 RepID=UPI0039C22A3C
MEKSNPKDFLKIQKETCRRLGFPDSFPGEMVAVAISTLGKMPVYGTRIILPDEEGISWFFHCGEYSDATDFYKLVHVEHLSEMLPSVLKYLRLPPRSRFIIDDQGYEDVWMFK